MASNAVDFSRTRREFQLHIEACRRCIADGLPNVALVNCMLSLVEDLAGQMEEVRTTSEKHRVTSESTMERIQFRLFGFDDEEEHPEEVGVLGDLRNRLREQSRWIKRAAWGVLTMCGIVAAWVVEQALAPELAKLFH